MILGKTGAYFERAKRSYGQAEHLIEGLDEAFQSAAFRDDPEQRYDTRVTLYQFDVILQAILLAMALSDGRFHRQERKLLLKLTKYGDLMDYLHKRDGARFAALTWDSLTEATPEQQRELTQTILPEELDRVCSSFVRPLAMADSAVVSIDFLQRLETILGEIADCMSHIDGTVRAEEAAAFRTSLEHLLSCRWQRIKDEISAEMAEEAPV